MQCSPSLNQLNRFSYSSFLASILLFPALLQTRLNAAIRLRIHSLPLLPLEAYHNNLGFHQIDRDLTVDIGSYLAELDKAIDFRIVNGDPILAEWAVLSEEREEINSFLEQTYLNIQ